MRKLTNRDYILIGIIGCAFVLFAVRLGYFQIVNGEKYQKAGESVSSKVITVEAARGEILDRNGTPLVVNRQGNSIVFYNSDFPQYSTDEKVQKIRNNEILHLIEIFEKRKEEWNDVLPLELNEEGQIAFKEDSENELYIFKSKDMLNLNSYATPDNCLNALIERYSLQKYTTADALKIASVCYGMLKVSFSDVNPYTFADDVSDELVSIIKENSNKFPGVDVEIKVYREYTDGTVAPHIIGMVGNISAEEYAEKSDTYKMTDNIGKSGIELAMEDTLRGQDGYKTIYKDSNGNTTTEYTKDPIQGNSVVLTIDAGLQKVTQKALKKCVDGMADEIVGTTPAGSAVVLDVNSGEVLAAATYPSYNITTYEKNYAKLSKNKGAPLWNRAFLSTYAPGSTMKPCIATAALEEKAVKKDDTVFCGHTYKYSDITLGCTGAHGAMDVVNAIKNSCNIFFYEMGRIMGIDTLNKYRTMYGLGQKTGIEIDEAVGVIDSPSYRQSINQTWYPGFTLQSAIGNSGDLCSPIQLANYCATVANGGTRYKCTLLKSIKTYDFTKTVWENSPVVNYKLNVKKSTLDLVHQGMRLVASETGCSASFNSLTVKPAAKTGTSQVERYVDGNKVIATNGFLITYAPYEHPEIAIAIAIEGAPSGASTAPVARDVYKYYFESKTNDEDNNENTVAETTTKPNSKPREDTLLQ